MPAIARIVVDVALDREFDYLVPAALLEVVKIGSRVNVPFGKGLTTGYVVSFAAKSQHQKLREIQSVVGDKPVISEKILELARWMGNYYGSPVEQAIRTVLPGAVRRKGTGFKKQMFVTLRQNSEDRIQKSEGGGAAKEERSHGLVTAATGGEERGQRSEVGGLDEHGGRSRLELLELEQVSETLKAERVLAGLSQKQKTVLELLTRSGDGMFLGDLLKDVGLSAAPVRSLEKKGLVTIAEANMRRDPLVNRTILRTGNLALMPEQEEALRIVRECVEGLEEGERGQGSGFGKENAEERAGEKNEPPISQKTQSGDERQPAAEIGLASQAGNLKSKIVNPPSSLNPEPRTLSSPAVPPSHVVLLYGVTGSGKTEVYLQGIDYVLKKGKGAIVLVPEIALTPQTVERFVGRFGDRIAVLHSHLSEGERHDEWHRINDGKADIVVGARSAIFAPVKNLGLIVVDEEHEPSYKQEEAPRYNARDVAVMRGLMEKCTVILGSATPSLESWYNARKGKYRLARLPIRADGRKMPAMRIIDMRAEAERVGHPSVFSKELLEAIKLRLDRVQQTILFLNRRGFATSLICPKCGYVAKCDQCSVSCTYHRTAEELRCHICGAHRPVPAKCPGCQDPAFKFSGTGTQRVETILEKCFPKARIQRVDADITTSKDSYDRIFGDFRVGKTDIIIGTQMIAKGLHFPNVTLVGVIHADLSLYMPDFRAGERTFQLLAQVAGRAGRGEVAGEVIIQTYTPFHVAIQAARRVDFDGFCDQEIEARRELNYPPFSHLVCLTFKGMSEAKVSFTAAALLKALEPGLSKHVIVSGVVPAPLARAKGLYRYQLMLRAPSTRSIMAPLGTVLKSFTLPDGVTCSVDVDAISLI